MSSTPWPSQSSKSVPIVMHVDGEILTIGRAILDGDEMVADINPILGHKIVEAIEKGDLESVSISFNTIPLPWHLPQMAIEHKEQ